jgi:hypothetical protein
MPSTFETDPHEVRELIEALGLGDAPGRGRQRLGTSGDDHVRLAGTNRAAGGKNGIEARALLPVDRRRRGLLGQSRRQCDDASRIPALRGIADHDLFHPIGRDAAIGQRREHDGRGELLDAARAMQAADPAERGTARRNNVGGSQRHRSQH